MRIFSYIITDPTQFDSSTPLAFASEQIAPTRMGKIIYPAGSSNVPVSQLLECATRRRFTRRWPGEEDFRLKKMLG
jgi:hypothetical protein